VSPTRLSDARTINKRRSVGSKTHRLVVVGDADNSGVQYRVCESGVMWDIGEEDVVGDGPKGETEGGVVIGFRVYERSEG